ncbi:shikimate kinase AroK [bacterium SCSIO 12696]|nr:shikimate kinase AroK [bacterium SCSIO 12696]
MKYTNNIFLVGPMGTGKTTIGRQLASALRMGFVDLDQAIEESCGADITWIFDVEGEQGFRRRESQVLQQLSEQSGVVLATGGGAVLAAENRQILKQKGVVVYLCSTIEQLLERTRKDRKRPLLQVDNPRDVLEKLMEQREPLYQEVADVVSTSRDQRPHLAAEELAEQLRPYLAL